MDAPVITQICTMRLMFPITTDEQAIAVKHTIETALQGIDRPQLHFNIMPMAALPPSPSLG